MAALRDPLWAAFIAAQADPAAAERELLAAAAAVKQLFDTSVVAPFLLTDFPELL